MTAAGDSAWIRGAVRAAYDAGADGWSSGPERAYRRMADALVAASPVCLAGALALDLGAGTGVASRALAAVGARPVAVDLAVGMLRHGRAERPPAAAGDALALPFRTCAFDAVVASFCLNHVPEPVRALAEAARVTRPGGAVLASVFSSRSEHPAKTQVEASAAAFGWRRPEWYERFKVEVEPLTNTPQALARAASAAGLAEVKIVEAAVDVGTVSPDDLVAWRLGTPALSQFVVNLDTGQRQALLDAALAVVGPHPEPWRPLTLTMAAVRPGRCLPEEPTSRRRRA